MGDQDEDAKFSEDEINILVQETIDTVIGDDPFENDKTKLWSSQIAEICIQKLTKLGKPFKYTLSCGVMQRNGAGIHSASACYWDNSTDGICSVRWENPTVHCIVTVFGFAL